MRKNKQAVLLSEGVRIILAVIALLILLYLAYQLYGLFMKKTDAEQAKETLKQLVAKINSLEENKKAEFLIVAPADYFLVSEGERVCMCDIYTLQENVELFDYKDQKENCLKNGLCEKAIYNIQVFRSIGEYSDPETGDPIPKDEIITVSTPFRLILKREGNSVNLFEKKDYLSSVIFDQILNYKKDKDSKSIEELNLDYVRAYQEGEDTQEIEQNIKESLGIYFAQLDTGALFGSEKEDFEWGYALAEGDKPLLTVLPPEGLIIIAENKKEFSYNEKSYIIDIIYLTKSLEEPAY